MVELGGSLGGKIEKSRKDAVLLLGGDLRLGCERLEFGRDCEKEALLPLCLRLVA